MNIDDALREVSARGIAVIKSPDSEAADRLETIARSGTAWRIGIRRSAPGEYTIWTRSQR